MLKSSLSSLFHSVLAVTILSLAALPVAAVEGHWSPIGPYGGTVQALAAAPGNPNILYAASSTGQVFRSTDAGTTWALRGRGISEGIQEFAVHPRDPEILYVLTFSTVFKSTDGGVNWTWTGLQPFVHTIAIAPSSPETVYVGGREGVLRSDDGGSRWVDTGDTRWVYSLAVHPRAPRTVYAGTSAGVIKSTDGGGVWTAVNTGLGSGANPPWVFSLRIDPRTPLVVYAGTVGQGIWRSTNGGASWSAASSGIELTAETYVTTIQVDPSSPSTVYASLSHMPRNGFHSGAVWKSIDRGGSWSKVYEGRVVPELVIDPRMPRRLYLALEVLGVFKSEDRGASWRASNQGLAATLVGLVAASPQPPGTLLASAFSRTVEFDPFDRLREIGLGLYRSTDSGLSWQKTSLPGTAYALAYAPGRPGLVYAGDSIGGFYRSLDDGVSWQKIGQGAPLFFWSDLAIDPSNPDRLYAVGSRLRDNRLVAGSARSADGGLTWTEVVLPDFGYGRTVAVDPVDPSRVYIGGSHLFLSTDRGETWSKVESVDGSFISYSSGPVRDILVSASLPRSIYLVIDGELPWIVKSEDGGATWKPVAEGLPRGNFEYVALLAEEPASHTLYASTAQGVYTSTDRGAHWEILGEELKLRMGSLAVSPAHPGKLYAGSFVGAHLFSPAQGSCAGENALCLNGGRFQVEVSWKLPDGRTGAGRPLPLTRDTGGFWFFGQNNLELAVKVLDGRTFNGNFWVFYAALSDIEYTLRVTDTATGRVRTYFNPPGRLASASDTSAFPGGSAPVPAAPSVPQTPGCEPFALCLQEGRFKVQVRWSAGGRSGQGTAVSLSDESGAFWFFGADNLELVVKLLDGRSENGHFWFYSAGLSDVQYTITVTDQVTGTSKTYTNPAGRLASISDTETF